MATEEKIKVSIIIPCRNEETYIRQCLDSIIRQSYGFENIEVLVLDGCSEDNTPNIIKEYSDKYAQIKYILNKKRIAPAAMNLGIQNAAGDIIVRVDGHVYLENNYIELCIKKLQSSNAECVGGKIININSDASSEAISLAMSSPFGVGNALFRYTTNEQYVDTLAFGAYKKDVFKKIGYFDEELVRNQDDELNYRLIKSGGKILLSPEIVSYYYTRSSFRKLWRQYFQYGFWKVRVIQKHKKPAAIRHLVPIAFVCSLMLGFALSLFFKPIRYLFLLEVFLYLFLSFIFSYKVSKGKLVYIPKIIISFFILHASYGLGFLEGFVVFYLLKSRSLASKNSKMSR